MGGMYKFLSVVAMMVLETVTCAASTDSITVSGKFTGIAADGRQSLIINECDICNKTVRRFVEFDSSGCFSEKIPFSYGHTFTIAYDGNFIEVYAEPSDSIHMDVDASRSPFEFHFSGDHAKLNEEFSHASKDLSRIYYEVSLPSSKTPYADYMTAFKEAVNHAQSIIDRYVADNNISDDTAEMLRKSNIYSIANQAADFEGESRQDKFAFFADSIFDIYNEDNARVMIFPYHLSALCLHFPEIIKETPKGLIRDLMYVIVSKDTVPSRSDFYNPDYYDRIFGREKTVIDLSKTGSCKVKVYRNGKVETLDNIKPLDWLRSQYPGRPIYLDISATWCGPCRASLTHSEDLRSDFAESDMVFAVLWLKSGEKIWTEFAPTIHNAVHILVDSDEMSDAFMGAFNLRGFPSYYFMNRDGSIVAEDVPGFHSPELYEYLKKALVE